MPKKPRVEFQDKDSGMEELAIVFSSGDSAVKVGFLRSSGVYVPKDDAGNQEPITMAQLGAIHEFGTKDGTIPERSFMRSAMDEGASSLTTFLIKVNKRLLENKISKVQALELLGAKMQSMFRAKITSGLGPPLKHRKGKPLFDTGQLKGNIDFEVE